MKQLSNKEIEENIMVLYEAGGTPLVFDWVREYNESNRGSRIPLGECKGCDMSSPSIEHTCLICGQATIPNKPKFFQAVLKPVKDVMETIYPKEIFGEMTLKERLGNEYGCCSECGGNEWMLLAKESVAVKQGGKPYIECLTCGEVTHL